MQVPASPLPARSLGPLRRRRALGAPPRRVTDAEAVAMSRLLLALDGLFVGSSSAVNAVGALRVAQALGAQPH